MTDAGTLSAMSELDRAIAELFEQWAANHDEHCSNVEWPELAGRFNAHYATEPQFTTHEASGRTCYWPMPDVLVDHIR